MHVNRILTTLLVIAGSAASAQAQTAHVRQYVREHQPEIMREFITLVSIPTVVSGHKSNNCSWLPSSIASNWEPSAKTAIEMGVFSKSVTLRICRSW